MNKTVAKRDGLYLDIFWVLDDVCYKLGCLKAAVSVIMSGVYLFKHYVDYILHKEGLRIKQAKYSLDKDEGRQ